MAYLLRAEWGNALMPPLPLKAVNPGQGLSKAAHSRGSGRKFRLAHPHHSHIFLTWKDCHWGICTLLFIQGSSAGYRKGGICFVGMFRNCGSLINLVLRTSLRHSTIELSSVSIPLIADSEVSIIVQNNHFNDPASHGEALALGH